MKSKTTRNDFQQPKQKNLPKNFWLIGFFILLSALAVVLIKLWSYWQKPVSGVAQVIDTPAASKKQIEHTRFEGQYISFRHDSDYVVKTHNQNSNHDNVILEQVMLSEVATSKKIALTVQSLVGRTMEDSANYNLRKTHPKSYHEEKFETEKIKGVIFTAKSDIYEKVVFIPKGKYLVEIALSTPLVDNDKLDNELEDIIGSIDFKQ